MIKIPESGKWMQNNQSDVFGNLWSSFNLDLTSKLGVVKVSPRMMVTTDNLTNLGIMAGFQVFTNTQATSQQKVWAVSGGFVWNVATTNGYIGAFGKDNTTGTPSGVGTDNILSDTLSDIITHGGQYLIVSTQTSLYLLDNSVGSWVGKGANLLANGVPHMMCVYKGTGRVYVTDADQYETSANTKIRSQAIGSLDTLVTSGSNFFNALATGFPISTITCLRDVSDGIWIFTLNQNFGGCWALKWDGITNNVATPYEIKGASGVLASVVIANTPWCIDDNGRLLYFNGGAFVEAPNGRLPIQKGKQLTGALNSTNNRWIHPNGMGLVNGRINILVNNLYNDNTGTIEENLPSGVWEYDSEIGWYHKYSLSQYVQNGGSITDYGQNRLSGVGALYANRAITLTGADSSTFDGSILAGAQYYSDASTTRYGTWTDNTLDTLQKYGYLVTPKIFSPNIQETWQKVYARHKKLLNAADEIIVKYRVADPASTEISITWTSTTTFTTTDANIANYAVGDEVEGVQGKGSGKTAQITVISGPSGPTYTVTLDEAFTGASSGTAKVRLQKWTKCGSGTSQTMKFHEFGIEVADTWIQLKVCLLFTGKDELNDLLLTTKEHQ